jgi:pyruvate-formate lyase-activating enzyme
VDSRPNEVKVLCLGNNTQDTDTVTRTLAAESSSQCHGLLSEIDRPLLSQDYQAPGYYHSSIYDIEFGRLIDIGNEFDMMIMLDQPVEEWSHPDAFYNTIRVLKGVKVPVKFLDPSFPQSVDYFKQLVDTNPSFCAFPFIELLVDRGNTTVCCRSTRPITPIHQLKDYKTDPNYQVIRQKMLAGERIPEHCGSCYALEDLGIMSARKQETVEWANRLQFKSVQDFCAVSKPVYYEVRASNKCNLQCRMCGPDSSHLIDREYRQIGLIDRFQSPAKKFGGGFDIVEFENLKKLYIAGGEPLVMHETYAFLDRCIRENKTDFELLINTNGTKLSERFKQILGHFSNLQFIFSIDAFGDLNHYIRWPSDWDVIVENWQYLRDQGHKVTVNTTVSIYNIHRLHELYQFIDDQFPGTLVHCQIVESPGYLSPWLFPERTRVLASLDQVQHTGCYKNDPLFASSIDGYLEFFRSENRYQAATLAEFFHFNDMLDRSRSIRLGEYDAILDSYRQSS